MNFTLTNQNKIFNQNKINVQNILDSAVLHYQKGEFSAAQLLFKKILKLEPNNELALMLLGLLAAQNKEYQLSITLLSKSISINPNYVDALYNRGNVLQNIDCFEEALDDYNKVILLKPEYSAAYNNRGNILRKLYRYEESLRDYNKAISLNPDYVNAYYNRVNVLKEIKRYGEALDDLNKVILLKPNYAEAFNNRGNILKEFFRFDEALSDYEKAISIKPNYAKAFYNCGVIFYQQGDFEKAINSYKKATEINPQYADAYNNLGNCYSEINDLNTAISIYEQALELNPNYVEVNFNLATALYKTKQYKKSADLFKKDHSSKSQNALLQCLHELDDKTLFLEQLDFLINKGENNAVIGSYVSRSNIKYGLSKSNPFCNEPLKYVFKNDLIPESDFKNIFIKGANDILNDERVKEKDQSLITNGIQTAGNIFTHLGEVTNEIKDVIHKEIEKYKLHFKGSEEGIIKSWPEQYELYGWLVSMKNGGELAPHMHEQGWLSGSVYINVPPRVNKDSGNLVLCLDKNNDVKVSSNQSKSVEVVTGNICLFPSSLLHYTIPFEGLEDRVVLAFDLVPKNK